MGILDKINSDSYTMAEQAAEIIKEETQNTFFNIVNAFNNGCKIFWEHPMASPSDIAAALGNDAKEIFQLHYALGQFISSINPEAIAPGLSVIGQFTMNEDGTVTVLNNSQSQSPPEA